MRILNWRHEVRLIVPDNTIQHGSRATSVAITLISMFNPPWFIPRTGIAIRGMFSGYILEGRDRGQC